MLLLNLQTPKALNRTLHRLPRKRRRRRLRSSPLSSPPTSHKLHDILLRAPGVLLPQHLHLLLHKPLVLARLLPGDHDPRRRLGLLQLALAAAAAVPRGVDALGVPLVLHGAAAALPHVLEVDVVRVLGRHLDAAVAKGRRALGRPDFEFLAVRVRGDAADHEVGEVAEFVRHYVEEAVLVVDDLFGELDGGVVAVFDAAGAGWVGFPCGGEVFGGCCPDKTKVSS